MKKVFIFLITLSLLLGACSETVKQPEPAAVETPVIQTEPVATPVPVRETFTPYTVIDMKGNEIVIEKPIERVSVLWPGAHVISAVVGAQDKIIATPASFMAPDTWTAEVFPDSKGLLTSIDSEGMYNIEELLSQQPDIVLFSGQNQYEDIAGANLPFAYVALYSFDDLKKVVQIVGKLYGEAEYEKALAYCKYVDDTLKFVAERVKDIPPEQRKKVYHNWGVGLMRTSGAHTIVNEWIEAAGGINSMEGYMDTTPTDASMEEILKEDPDVLLMGGSSLEQTMAELNSLPAWKQIKAVKNNQIYKCPAGVCVWDRYGVESPLMVLWAAKTLYPDKFEDIDIAFETKQFYKTFYDYELTDEQVQLILECKLPG